MLYNFSLAPALNLNIFKIFLQLTICLIYSTALSALPDLNQVVNGKVSITQAGEQALQINQNTDKAIVNWNSFNIDAGEKVHFQQPIDGVCLNRIDAINGMSQIYGSLSSTSKIFLINQAGILFAENAQVNVGGIIASAIDIADDNFMNNKLIFDRAGAQSGAIINRGVINVADKGIAALLGASVANDGIIQAKISNIALASGDKITLDLYGNDMLIVTVDAPTTATSVDENGNSLPHGVDVSGQIINDGGTVFITAKAAQGIFDNLINMSGVVRARTVETKAGKIILLGYEGTVKVTGELDVTGQRNLEFGGYIGIFGEHLIVDDYAFLNSSAGIGESYHGLIWIGSKDQYNWISVPHTKTKTVYVGSNVKLNADATNSGSGGSIFVLADLDITFQGTASARGALLNGGRGGNVILMSDYDYVHPYFDSTRKIDVSSLGGGKGFKFVTSPFYKYIGMPIFRFREWISG